MESWIKLYRKFDEWEWFNISEMVHLFIYLLLNANNTDNEWRGIKVKRGQIITGRKTLHEKTKISEQTLRTCLRRLESTKEITIESTNQYSIITICNYELYQGNKNTINQLANQQLTSDQPATNQQLTTIKEEKNIKNEKNIDKKASKSPDFIDQLLDCFIQEHGSYEIMNKGKERTAMSTILKKYKEKYPAATSEETIEGLRSYFKMCINIPDVWLMNNMSPSIIVSKFNEINKILKNGKHSKNNGASEETIARIIAENFGIDSDQRK